MAIDYILLPLSQLISSEEYSGDILLGAIERFKCSKEKDLEMFIHDKAIAREENGSSRTYIFLNENLFSENEIEIMAFYTIAQTSLNISYFSQSQRKKILGSAVDKRDELEHCASYLIGQLGRNDEYTCNDLQGELILKECLKLLKNAQEGYGGDLLVLECHEHMYKRFYSEHGFSILPTEDVDDSQQFFEDVFATLMMQKVKVKFKLGSILEGDDLKELEEKYGDIAIDIYNKYGEDITRLLAEQNGRPKEIRELIHSVILEYKEFVKQNQVDSDLITVYHRLSKIEFE